MARMNRFGRDRPPVGSGRRTLADTLRMAGTPVMRFREGARLRGRHLPNVFGIWLLLAISTASAGAEDAPRGSPWEGSYAGLSLGVGRLSSDIRDIDGFADWGNPGATRGYDTRGALGGAFAGRRFALGGVSLRYEVEAMLGDLSARTDRLDPTCPDEAAATRFHWAVAARIGVEEEIGSVRAFALAGPALARIVNSVTDTDYSGSCLERDLRLDADDSFRHEATRLGWTLGVGVETEVTPRWALRLDAAYFDFGEERYRVNRSGDNPCGPDGPRAPCGYAIDNRMTVLRVAVVYRFGRQAR